MFKWRRYLLQLLIKQNTTRYVKYLYLVFICVSLSQQEMIPYPICQSNLKLYDFCDGVYEALNAICSLPSLDCHCCHHTRERYKLHQKILFYSFKALVTIKNIYSFTINMSVYIYCGLRKYFV
jgi:hypothetical protein